MSMKIYLVTMKGLPDNAIDTRMKCMAREAEWDLRNADRIAFSPPQMEEVAYAEVDGAPPPAPAPVDPDPRPKREYNWLNESDDARYIQQWRDALNERKDLLEKIGISIQPERVAKDDDNEFMQNRHFNNPTFACVGEQLLQILEVDDSVTVKSAAPVATDSHEGLLARLAAVVNKLEKVEIPDPQNIPGHIYNEHCEVHTPGNMLATYNETMLLEDACTDALQTSMDDGWRIVAVCPQAQRRPDYIMGRWNPDYRSGNGAKRKP